MLVFGIYFDSYFYDSHFNSYLFISFYEFSRFHFLQIKILCSVGIFLGIFCIILIYVAILCSGYEAHLILSAFKPRHGKITVIPNNMKRYTSFTINDVTFIDSCQFMLSSPDKLSSNSSKDQFREIRKYLEAFYAQQPNQPQINNVTVGGKEGEVMHIYEDYQNRPYQIPTPNV